MQNSKLRIQSRWLSGCVSVEDKEARIQKIMASRPVLDLLAEIVDRKRGEAAAPRAQDYDKPSWAYKQADTNGYVRALDEVLLYLTFDN